MTAHQGFAFIACLKSMYYNRSRSCTARSLRHIVQAFPSAVDKAKWHCNAEAVFALLIHFYMQVSAYEIQTQQLQTILNKRANDNRAAGLANDEIVAQVSHSFASV